MTQWTLEHPVLTTIIIIFAIGMTHDIIVNGANALSKKKGGEKMTDEMLRKYVMFSALLLAIDSVGGELAEIFTEEEIATIDAIFTEETEKLPDSGRQELVQTMLREHLADILATTKEVEE
ncbi:hypothetical protein J2T13_000182 [Paenibacillus sp. DS2015]|uniref:hypothetical protein n=1 Tax=Paenibacillus sp. DS2015 TaxID=3373917 RepID=UPI003D1D8378